MDKNIEILYDIKIEKTKAALLKNNFEVEVFENEFELQQWIKNKITDCSTVAVGGSQTLFQTGVIDLLKEMPINYIDRYKEGLNSQELHEIYRQSFLSDYYIMSSNAITMKGELFNVDGNGNRVAALTYGPNNVIVVVGINKIVTDIQEAKARICATSAPANALRLNLETPCTNFGECDNCKSKNRICNHYVITRRQVNKGRICIAFVKKHLGY